MLRFCSFLFLALIVITITLPTLHAEPIEPITIKRASIFDPVAGVTDFAPLGQNASIRSVLVNNLNIDQEFQHIVLIQDSEGITVFLSIKKGKLRSMSTQAVNSEPWFVEEIDKYRVQIFVWDSKANPLAFKAKIFHIENFNP